MNEPGGAAIRLARPSARPRLAPGMPTSGLAVLKFDAAQWRAAGAGTLTRLVRQAVPEHRAGTSACNRELLKSSLP